MANSAAFSGEVEVVLPSSWEDPRRLLSTAGELEEWKLADIKEIAARINECADRMRGHLINPERHSHRHRRFVLESNF